MNDNLYYLLFIFMLSMSISVKAESTQTVFSQWKGKPFTAIQTSYETVMPDKITKAKVYMSQYGARLEGMVSPNSPVDAELIYLYQSENDRNLLIDPVQQSYMVFEEMTSIPGAIIKDDKDKPGTVLSHKPCLNFNKAEKVGIESIQNRKVVKWECINDKGKVKAVQWFDVEYKIVMKEENAGKITELHSIQTLMPKKAQFEPPNEYKKMSMLEMMTGYVDLEKYQGK